MINKRIIYIIPWEIKPGKKSSTGIRPLEMLQGFRDAGFEVDLVMGSSLVRKQAIRRIKRKIREGVRYDFLYGESSTAPLLIAQGKKNIVKRGFQDIRFLLFCRRKGIPTGFFYRDIHWKFKEHSRSLKGLKRMIFFALQKRDLSFYNKICHVVFLPSLYMKDYLPELKVPCSPLPPAIGQIKGDRGIKELIALCYVGGLGSLYDIKKALEVLSTRDTPLYVSTREYDYPKVKEDYESLITENITVEHLSGEELEPLFRRSSLALNWVKPVEYYRFAMPLKIFTYLQHGLPVVSVKGTANGKFIEENGFGWAIPYERKAFSDLIDYLEAHPEEVTQKTENVLKGRMNHTWQKRAEQAARDILENA